MGLRIDTNIQSLEAQRNLSTNQNSEDTATRRLASGTRVTKAADDPSGLAIASKMTATSRSMSMALRNTQDGISMVQVTEGALQGVGSMLIRLRELAIQASSDTIGDTERGMLNKEVEGIRDEIDRVSDHRIQRKKTSQRRRKLAGVAAPSGNQQRRSQPDRSFSAKIEL